MSWSFRKQFTVNGASGLSSSTILLIYVVNSSGTDTTDTIYTDGNANPNFSDIRFTQSDGTTQLKYFNWNHKGNTGLYFVEIPAGLVSNNLYIYYGTNSFASNSDSGIFSYVFEDMLSTPSGTLVGNATYDSTNHWVLLNPATASTAGSLVYTLPSPPQKYGMIWEQKIGGGNGADSELGFSESQDTFPVGDTTGTGYSIISDEYTSYFRLSGNGTQIANVSKTVNDNVFHTIMALITVSGVNRAYRIDYDYATQFSGITSIIPTGTRQLFGWNGRSGGSYDNHIVGQCAVFPYTGLVVNSTATAESNVLTIEIQVAQVDDSCGHWSSTTNFSTSQLLIGTEAGAWSYGVYLRFLGVSLPTTALTTLAYIRWVSYDAESLDTVNSRITGDKEANPAIISQYGVYINRRGTIVGGANNDYITSTQVDYDSIEHTVAGGVYQTPDFSAIVNEILAAVGSINAMGVFWDDYDARSTGSGNVARKIYTYSDSVTNAPVLHINYTYQHPTITNQSLPDPGVGLHYSQQLTAMGGTSPYTYSLDSGTLPKGLSLSSSGLLSGKPTTLREVQTVTFRVTDSLGDYTTSTFTLKTHYPSIGPSQAIISAYAVINTYTCFYANGRYWLFYAVDASGTYNVVSSVDGLTWSSPTTVIPTGTVGIGFNCFWDGTYFHMAWEYYGKLILEYRRIKPNTDGTLTMDAVQSVPVNYKQTSDLLTTPSIIVDSGGYPWICYDSGSLSLDTLWLQKSTTNDGVWNDSLVFQYDTSPSGVAPTLILSPNGELTIIGRYGSGFASVDWNNHGGTWHQNLSPVTSPSPHGARYLTATVNDNNEVCVAYTDYTSSDIIMSIRDPDTLIWTRQTILSAAGSTATPFIVYTPFGFLCFWNDDTNFRIYYKLFNGSKWDTDSTYFIDASGNPWSTSELTGQISPTVGPFPSLIGDRKKQYIIAYEGGTASPYAVNVAIMYDVVTAGAYQGDIHVDQLVYQNTMRMPERG